MPEVIYTHLVDGCPWPEQNRQVRIRPIDVARAAATTLSAGRDLRLERRIVRMAGVVFEVMAHLRGDWSGRRLRTVGLDGLDATARAEVVQRIGVGLARLVAERNPLGLVDFYNLDALASDPSAPVTVTRKPRHRRRPDFVGSDAGCSWSLLEAKGRTGGGELRKVRLDALDQVASVDLLDQHGEPIHPVTRVSCVSRLSGEDITVFADDPPADAPNAQYRINAPQLVYDYYSLVRDLVRVVGGNGPRISGAASYVALPLLGNEQLILGVHARLLRALDDADQLVAIRGELRDAYARAQPAAERAQDLDLSIGPDGLALASRDPFMQAALAGDDG
jgi:hypothetical protein